MAKPTATPPRNRCRFEDTSVEKKWNWPRRCTARWPPLTNGRWQTGVWPFATLEAALADMQSAAEGVVGWARSIEEAEDELGISDWVDPDTRRAAEGIPPRTSATE